MYNEPVIITNNPSQDPDGSRGVLHHSEGVYIEIMTA